MAQSSNYQTILNSVTNAVAGLNLVIGSTVVPVAQGKLPRAEEKLDTPLPKIYVTPAEKPEDVKIWAFTRVVMVTYHVGIVFINDNAGDLTGTNLDAYLAWRAAVRSLYQGPAISNIPQAFKTFIDMDAPLDRSQLNERYDWSAMNVRVMMVEPMGLGT